MYLAATERHTPTLAHSLSHFAQSSIWKAHGNLALRVNLPILFLLARLHIQGRHTDNPSKVTSCIMRNGRHFVYRASSLSSESFSTRATMGMYCCTVVSKSICGLRPPDVTGTRASSPLCGHFNLILLSTQLLFDNSLIMSKAKELQERLLATIYQCTSYLHSVLEHQPQKATNTSCPLATNRRYDFRQQEQPPESVRSRS